MPRNRFLLSLVGIAALTAFVAMALHLAFGPRWFSYYGWAAASLVATLALSRILRARFKAQGFSRWPRYLFTLPATLAALVQIGFWVAFFNGGPSANMLGPARSLLLAEIGPWLTPALAGVLLTGTLLIARGLLPGHGKSDAA